MPVAIGRRSYPAPLIPAGVSPPPRPAGGNCMRRRATTGRRPFWMRNDSDPKLAAAMCRAYNRWLADYCKPYPDRLFGVAMLPMQSVNLAIEEMRFARKQLGMKGGFLRPNPYNGRMANHPDYDPFWAEVQELDFSIGFHEGASGGTPTVGRDLARHCHWLSRPGVARLLAVLRQRRSTFSKPFEVSQRPRLARQTPRLRSHCALPANVGDALGESDPARSAQPESRTRTAARTILLYFMTASTVG